MKILLTNDDGYKAPNIQSLFKKLSKEYERILVCVEDDEIGDIIKLALCESGIMNYVLCGEITSMSQVEGAIIVTTKMSSYLSLDTKVKITNILEML